MQPGFERLIEYLEDANIDSELVIELIDELWLKLSKATQNKIAEHACPESEHLSAGDLTLIKEEAKLLVSEQNKKNMSLIIDNENSDSVAKPQDYLVDLLELWIQQETCS